MERRKTAVVLGAYGLIGAACARALMARGVAVIGVGRSQVAERRALPMIRWIERDIARTPASTWAEDLADADIVVNAAGALQDGARDRLAAIHETAVFNLVAALEGRAVRFIQISAVGATVEASTAFLRTKARGDAAVMASPLDWVILRPALVLGPQAYGGTALLRAAAAIPCIGVSLDGDPPIQTVALSDVAEAVVEAALGAIPARTVADLAEARARPFSQVVAALRGWLGFPRPKVTVRLPMWLLTPVGWLADGLGWLGWRSPVRSTALSVLRGGVMGHPTAWPAAGGRPCRALEETLDALPATAQERWFARLFLLMPIAVACLAVFWIGSGAIALAMRSTAEGVLLARGVPPALATATVVGGAAVNILLGAAVLARRWAQPACLAMVAVSAAYLVGGTIVAPDLWADPLGPLMKVLPGAVLALVTAVMVAER